MHVLAQEWRYQPLKAGGITGNRATVESVKANLHLYVLVKSVIRRTHTHTHTYLPFISLPCSPPSLFSHLSSFPSWTSELNKSVWHCAVLQREAVVKGAKAGFKTTVAGNRGYNEVGAEKRRKYYFSHDEAAVASAKNTRWSAGIRVLTCFDVTFSSRCPHTASSVHWNICFNSSL